LDIAYQVVSEKNYDSISIIYMIYIYIRYITFRYDMLDRETSNLFKLPD